MEKELKDAVVVVIERNGKFLFVQKSKDSPAEMYWAPVSGRVETDETQEDAVKREALEEVGLVIVPLKKEWECKSEFGNFLLHWWSAKIISGIEHVASKEISMLKWVTVEEMKKLKPVFEKDIEFFEHKELHS